MTKYISKKSTSRFLKTYRLQIKLSASTTLIYICVRVCGRHFENRPCILLVYFIYIFVQNSTFSIWTHFSNMRNVKLRYKIVYSLSQFSIIRTFSAEKSTILYPLLLTVACGLNVCSTLHRQPQCKYHVAKPCDLIFQPMRRRHFKMQQSHYGRSFLTALRALRKSTAKHK